ncbi:MAG: type II toxin-antitoxin system MqsA family antitoxin [Lachnospiraceae bacterium]|nr:type II toxin-antitoxin system MqsA family antitoxin [Lachnospiraceae bacterium]
MGTRYGNKKGEAMMCVFCGGTLKEFVTDYVEKIDNYVVVIRNVPCKKCMQCGEEYFSSEVALKIETILDSIQKISSEITVTVIDFKQAA